MNNLEETDTKDLILKRKGDKIFKGTRKKCKKEFALTIQIKKSTIFLNEDTWNGLKEEVIMTKNIHQLKEKLDKYRYVYRTIQV